MSKNTERNEHLIAVAIVAIITVSWTVPIILIGLR